MSGAGPVKLTGWLGNKADSPVELPVTEALADEFLESRYYDPDLPIGQRSVLWLAAADGKNVAFDPAINGAALDALYWHIRRREHKKLGKPGSI